MANPPIFAFQHICRISIVLVNVVLQKELKVSPICQQIGFERNQLFGKLGLYTRPKQFLSFAPERYTIYLTLLNLLDTTQFTKNACPQVDYCSKQFDQVKEIFSIRCLLVPECLSKYHD